MSGPIICHRIPINVTAWQIPEFDDEEWRRIAEWCKGVVVPSRPFPVKTPAFILVGKDQRVPAFVGDWVVKNSLNDIYPVPELLFAQSYEVVPAIGEPLANYLSIK